MLLSALPSFSAFAAWDGSTKSEPVKADGVYQISSAEELAWFAEYVNTLGAADTGLVNEDAVLTQDIDLSNKEWTPIGLIAYVTDAYAGTFDGQNHTVSNLKINATAANYGLFGTVNTGTVKNLKVEGNVASTNVVGGIVGKLQTGTVDSCSFAGSVTTTGKTTKGYVGGIVGTVGAKNAVITACANSAEVSGAYAGGIVGYNKNAGAVTSYCYNTGKISGTSRSGGIAGQQSLGSISYCYNAGDSTNGISGFSNASYTECWYLYDEKEAAGGSASGQKKITDSASLLTALNSGAQALFCENGDGYPLLIWQMAGGVISVPVTHANIIGNAVTGETLTAQALGENDESATNTSYQWAVSGGDAYTDIDGATESTFDIPDTAEYAGKIIRLTVFGEEDSSAVAYTHEITKSAALIEKEDTEKAEAALASITLDKTVIKEECTLDLPSSAAGCPIKWASSNEDIITSDGAVTLPEKNIVKITLTATAFCGNITKSKNFTLDVWAKDIDPAVYLDEALDSIKWSFSSLQPQCPQDTNIINKLKELLSSKGFDGITVTIKSTADESLISKNGKITYPAPPAQTFADGKQVQVFFSLSVGDETAVYPSSQYALLIPWNTQDVLETLKEAADKALTEASIKGENEALSSATLDLTLPSHLDGDRTSYAWISWESSDPDHLSISDENRKSGADSLYNPYVGKIHQDGEEHKITLTATAENPSTGVTYKKSFEITVPAMSEEELNQSLDMMNKILSYYTADKLKAFADKSALDCKAVKGDIQLVIPKEVLTKDELSELDYGKYWDYWNYKFTVESSNKKVVEINSFRAKVYRPLDKDKRVALTVKMTSKSNPNLSVSKTLEITVKKLTRAELNSALELMDRVKEVYESALLGKNDDAFSVIDNLSPFCEAVWNGDKTDVDIIRASKDMKNTGIIVDTLPGWEEQEDWRLFRSTNKELIANETLVLESAPDEDSFVRINSVLTDAVFGSYYEKFKNDKSYDKEALAKFKQLYKQPVSAYFMVLADGSYDDTLAKKSAEEKKNELVPKLAAYKNALDRPISVTFTLLGLDKKVIIPKTTEKSFTKGATVFDVFKKVLAENGVSYRAKGSYVSSIGGLSEFDYGENSGWMYTVGNVFVNSYMNAQELSGNEDIVVMFVRDYLKANTPDKEDEKNGDKDENKDGDKDKKDGKSNRQDDKEDEERGERSQGDGSGSQLPDNQSNGVTPISTNPSDTAQNPEAAKAEEAEEEKDAQDEGETKDDLSPYEDPAKGDLDPETEEAAASAESALKKYKTPIIIGGAALALALILLIILLKRRKKDEEEK